MLDILVTANPILAPSAGDVQPSGVGFLLPCLGSTRLACGLVRWLRRVWGSTWLVRPRRVWGPGRGSLRLLGSALRVARGGSQWLACVLRSPWGARGGSRWSRGGLREACDGLRRLATACGGWLVSCGCSDRLAGCLVATRCGLWGLVVARGDWLVLRGLLGGLGSARGCLAVDFSGRPCGGLAAAGWCLADSLGRFG